MGQELSLPDLKMTDWSIINDHQSDQSVADDQIEDIYLFLPLDVVNNINKKSVTSSITKQTLIKQIRDYLSVLTKSSGIDQLNEEMQETIQHVFDRITVTNNDLENARLIIIDKQQCLKTSYITKLADNAHATTSIFGSTDDNTTEEIPSHQFQTEQFSYFAVQSFLSMFLMLLKCVEKNEPTIVYEMLNLINQLVEQIPLKYFLSDSSKRSIILFTSLKPLTDYIEQLLIQTSIDPKTANQGLQILLTLSVIKTSLGEMLPLLKKLLFDTENIYDLRKLFLQLNKTISDPNHILLRPVEYLKSIEAFPNTKLTAIGSKKFTGQFISSVLIAHIDLHNQTHGESQFEGNSLDSSFSFEWKLDTFQHLYEMIVEVTNVRSLPNIDLEYILAAYLRLFTTHLKFLMFENIDPVDGCATDKDVETWFSLMLKLALDDHSDEIKSEASRAVIVLLDMHLRSFPQILAFIHTYIMEKKHPILIKLLLEKLATNVFLRRWIEVLSDDQHLEHRPLTYRILHEWIDAEEDGKIMPLFQELLLVHLNNQPMDTPDILEPSSLSILVVEYISHVIKSSLHQGKSSVLLEPLLFGLCILTESKYNFALIQPILTATVPLFAQYLTETTLDATDMKLQHLTSWLLGKMVHRLIIGPSSSSLEKKYAATLQLSLFAGGYETMATEMNAYLSNLLQSNMTKCSDFVLPSQQEQTVLDKEFLLSIYHNVDPGSRLISKMKLFIRDKQRFLQKSIESYANDACAALFAVYIKHYRRVDLARHELSQSIDQKPHNKLLSLYEYANQVQNIFATTKARGGDCDQLLKQIKSDALLLLVSVKESPFIPLIKDNFTLPIIPNSPLAVPQRMSRWTKVKSIIRLLRNVLNACVRLKYLMLARKEAVEQRKDSESILHQAIVTCLYGNYLWTSNNQDEVKKIQSEEVIQCLIRQHQRALTRLISYRFMNGFLEQLITTKDNEQVYKIIVLLLTNLKDDNLQWHFLERIDAANHQWKEEIGHQYYSMIKKMTLYSTKSTLPSTDKPMLTFRLFNLLNLSYDSMDLCHIHQFQLINFLRLDSTDVVQIDMKLVSYNSFRLFVFQLCENIESEQLRSTQLGSRKFHHIFQQQRQMIFNQIIFTKLQQLQQEKEPSPSQLPSLKNLLTSNRHDDIFSYLMLLLRCVHLYDHVRLICATIDYVHLLLDIYHHNELLTIRLLALKVLRDLLLVLPQDNNQLFMETLLKDILTLIGQHFNPSERKKVDLDLVIEWIFIYRTIVSPNSLWQKVATQFIIETLQLTPVVETMENSYMNILLASLCILGGSVRPFCLGSTTEIYSTDSNRSELETAIIIEIDHDTSKSKPYLVQYAQSTRTESVSSSQLRIITDVPSPNLLQLPIDNAADTILDALASLAQIDTSQTDSLLVLQIKRRAISALYPLLNNKALVEIFMQKPYASVIAKLSMPVQHSLSMDRTLPNDLRCFNRFHLERYSLSLDKCERTQDILEDPMEVLLDKNQWNKMQINRDPMVVRDLSSPYSVNDVWKPKGTRKQVQYLKKGRIGSDEISIVGLPADDTLPPLEECGEKHKFLGRVNITDDLGHFKYPTFIVDNLQLTEGKWYYCVRIPLGGATQIGWASPGFTPDPPNSKGVGEDGYSWSYDGSKGYCFSGGATGFATDTLWKEDDVCGCGIEIDGENTLVNYWLNGQFLGTAMSHHTRTDMESTIKANLLPNGLETTYFPSVTVQVHGSVANTGVFEFIFSPEDMKKCPLPEGYQPLLISTLLIMKNILVPYPYSAFLVGSNHQQYFYTPDEGESRSSYLRDFVNGDHVELPFPFETNTMKIDHLLKLSEDNEGLPVTVTNTSSLTISFDFETLSTAQSEIVLFALEDELYPVQIPQIDVNDDFFDETMKFRQRVAILFQINKPIKVYINNTYQTFPYHHNGDLNSKAIFKLKLLPYLNAGIENLGVWKYALSEEHIRRLFTYSLSYVAVDYQNLNEYQKRANTFVFTSEKNSFKNGTLVPFKPESISFKPIFNSHRFVMQLSGNESYLTLDTSDQEWFEYTLVLDISIPNFPSNSNEKLTLMTVNRGSEIFITHDGHICLSEEQQSLSVLKLQEVLRLVVSVQRSQVHIYVNGSLELTYSIIENQFSTNLKRIDLFRETDATKNTIKYDQVRIQCRSVTFWPEAIDTNRPFVAKLIRSTEFPLDELVAPPFKMISKNLLAIGYEEESIKNAVHHFNTTNIQSIDTILREQAEQLEILCQQELHKKKSRVLARLSLHDESHFLSILTNTSQDHVNDAEEEHDVVTDNEWYGKSFREVGIYESFSEWIKDKTKNKQRTMEYFTHQLVDLIEVDKESTITDNETQKISNKSLDYVHRQISRKTFIQSRRSSENGLLMIYARYTVLNILKVWCNDDQSSLFPMSQFGDQSFLVTLLKLMNHHYTYRRTRADETVDRMGLVTLSILKAELKLLLKSMTNDRITEDLLSNKAPLLFQLQKYVIEEFLQCLIQLPIININDDNDYEMIDEQTLIKQPNLNFLLKIIHLFSNLLTDEEMNKFNINHLVQLLFPPLLIKLIFDLFLLVKLRRWKIFILRLLTTLIRKSEHVELHLDIQHFLHRLYIELTTNTEWSNTTELHSFRQILMDLNVALWERRRELNKTSMDDPLDLNYLFPTIMIIGLLTNRTKQSQWPEVLITQSVVILGKEMSLTKEMLETTHQYFNSMADEQLMQYMNDNLNLDWKPLPNEAIQAWIDSLPNEPIAHSSHYNAYTCLCDIPTTYIQARAKLFYLFNIFINKILPDIDLSVPAESSLLTDRVGSARNYILSTTKYQLFHDTLSKTGTASGTYLESVRFDTIQGSLAEHPEDTMFNQAYEQLYSKASQTFLRTKDEQAWTAVFTGMYSTDRGGPYRDSITRICADICSTRLPLFILCPNGRTNSGTNRDRWIPNVFPPNHPIPTEYKNQYRFVGQLMGMAIRTRNYLDLRFPTLLWKQLVKDKVTIKDIEAIDIQSFTIINEMEENIRQVNNNDALNDDDNKQNLDYLFDSIMSELTFETVSSVGETYELVPGGSNIPINANNFEYYCILNRQYRLTEFDRQINFIRQGLYSVVPSTYLILFSARELEEAVCGKGYIDVDMLKRHTSYGSDSETSPHIQLFWTVLNEMFSEEQKKLFLIFVWGRSALPSSDEDFTTNFSINRLDPSGDANETLPKSHTCFFTLDLPPYSNKEAMYERLNYAITYCSSIDTDGAVN